jgi:hypothetical protein
VEREADGVGAGGLVDGVDDELGELAGLGVGRDVEAGDTVGVGVDGEGGGGGAGVGVEVRVQAAPGVVLTRSGVEMPGVKVWRRGSAVLNSRGKTGRLILRSDMEDSSRTEIERSNLVQQSGAAVRGPLEGEAGAQREPEA